MQARYANGRAAVTADAAVEFTGDGVVVVVGGETLLWSYGELRRADDENGPIALRREPDTGQRLTIAQEHRHAVHAAAPQLFKARVRGIESIPVVVGLVAAAWVVAALFLIGVPLEAKPIADVAPDRWRERVSDLSWSQLSEAVTPCDDADAADRVLNGFAQRLMVRSNVRQRDKIWISIVHGGAVGPNALTMPDDRIVITDALVALTDDPDELAGVLAHEIAHVELNHVMASVVRNIGAGFFFDILFGGGGVGQIVAVTSVTFARMPFSREDESAADARGMQYLDAIGVDPGGIARLFDRIAKLQGARAESGLGAILASHPPTAARAAIARAHAHTGRAPALTAVEWRIVQRACGGATARPRPQPQAPKPAAAQTSPPQKSTAAKP